MPRLFNLLLLAVIPVFANPKHTTFWGLPKPGNANWALTAAGWQPLRSSLVRLVSSLLQLQNMDHIKPTPFPTGSPWTYPGRVVGHRPAGWADLPRRSGRGHPAHRLSRFANMRRTPAPSSSRKMISIPNSRCDLHRSPGRTLSRRSSYFAPADFTSPYPSQLHSFTSSFPAFFRTTVTPHSQPQPQHPPHRQPIRIHIPSRNDLDCKPSFWYAPFAQPDASPVVPPTSRRLTSLSL